MRNQLYLIATFIFALLLSGCGDNSKEKTIYQLEKLHADAQKAGERLGIKPELATEADLRAVIDEHEEVVQYFQENFSDLAEQESPSESEIDASNLAGQSLLRTAELSLQLGDTTAAEKSLADFETIFHHNPQQQKFAWLRLAHLLDDQRKTEKVEQIYNKLIETYYPPVDSAGVPDMDIVSLPHDLAAYFYGVGNEDKGLRYSKGAIDYYNQLRNDYPASVAWMAATRLLAETYRSTDQPQAAIDLLLSTVDSSGTFSRGPLMLAAQTFLDDLAKPDSAVKYYRRVLDFGIDSLYAPTALLQLGNALLREQRYQQSRDALNQLLELEYAAEHHPLAQRMIAVSYEEQKQYNQARDAYTAIIERYPTHSISYETYLYLPEFFDKQGKKQLSDQWYNRAEAFFAGMRNDYPRKTVGAAAQEYLARLYIKYEAWDDAVRALRKLPEDFKNFRFANDAYFRIGAIFQNRLNQADSARVYYQKQIDAYPGSRPSELAMQSIETL